jgi:GTPase SAR1 family protein
MITIDPKAPTQVEPRIEAFCSIMEPEPFGGVVHGSQIWIPDPFDVETIHAESRATFESLLARASGTNRPEHGQTLLLLGEGGSGKTHLMRAFRHETHRSGQGYFAYLQMTTTVDNYYRYMLSNVVDSLEKPYLPNETTTGLTRLARGLLDRIEVVDDNERVKLCSEVLEQPAELADLVHRIADLAVQSPKLPGIDKHLDLVRALLYLLSNDRRVRPRVLKWLRCEDLSNYDRDLIDLVPRTSPESALQTIAGLGAMMAAVDGSALVICADQLEEILDQVPGGTMEQRAEPFRQAINALVNVADRVPNAVVVISCISSLFDAAKDYLPKPKLDRIMRPAGFSTLKSSRSTEEISQLVSRRLEWLYDEKNSPFDAQEPTFPFTLDVLSKLAGLSTRLMLDKLRSHREKCVRAGEWIKPDFAGDDASAQKVVLPPDVELDRQWNDFRATFTPPALDEETQQAELLKWAIEAVSAEMPAGLHFSCDLDNRHVPTLIHLPDNAVEKLMPAICEKNSKGGGLSKQIDELKKRAGEIPAVIVRSTDFPKTPGADITKKIASLIAPRGRWRRVLMQDDDWRTMSAFRAFHGKAGNQTNFATWQKESKPLSTLPAIEKILGLRDLLSQLPKASAETAAPPPPPPAGIAMLIPAAAPVSPPAPPPPNPPTPSPTAMGPLPLGKRRGMDPSPVTIDPQILTQHAAFLGGTGSGKTTAALRLIEHLLLQGIPAVLVDPKGDLCRYADPEAWDEPLEDPELRDLRARVRECIDVQLFTPGNSSGRPLAIPVVPRGIATLPSDERERAARTAANALGGMLFSKVTNATAPLVAILQKAIEIFANQPEGEFTLRDVHRLIREKDESLTLAVDGLPHKHFTKLGESLTTIMIQRRDLLGLDGGETLSLDVLLGKGSHNRPGKTRLSIVNTQALTGDADKAFWLAQFASAIDSWGAKHPSKTLQAVFLFDEADKLLPATKQPPTKQPMEDLLRRARSKGIGIFLGSQSPGDFDYKCRDQIRMWLIGRIGQQRSREKVRQLLEPAGVDAHAKLPHLPTGHFFLADEKTATPIVVDRNVIPTENVPENRIGSLARDTMKQG